MQLSTSLPGGYTAEVDQINESTWSECQSQFGDASVYQTWAYGAVHWGESNLSHFVLKRNAQIVAMAQCRILRPPLVPWGMAYLRWGPLCRSKHSPYDDKTLYSLASALAGEYIMKRGLWLRVLSHVPEMDSIAPIWVKAFESAGLRRTPGRPSYRTFLLDLKPPLEELRRSLDQKWRNQLNQACRNQLSIVEGTSEDLFDKFIAIYDEMLRRKHFDRTVDVREFRKIQTALPDSFRMNVMLCEHEGRAIAGLVGAGVGTTGSYLLGATNADGMRLKGAYLLQWQMIGWLKQMGCTRYDLGGINPEKNPGVYHFKKGLSGTDVSYLGEFDGCRHPLSATLVRIAEWTRARH
jgi:hypothetical protein